jgi:hypothetical protein
MLAVVVLNVTYLPEVLPVEKIRTVAALLAEQRK